MDGWVSSSSSSSSSSSGGGSGRRAAVDEGGVDHRQVEAGRKHVDVRVAAHGVEGGGHPAEGERQAGAELKLRATAQGCTIERVAVGVL